MRYHLSLQHLKLRYMEKSKVSTYLTVRDHVTQLDTLEVIPSIPEGLVLVQPAASFNDQETSRNRTNPCTRSSDSCVCHSCCVSIFTTQPGVSQWCMGFQKTEIRAKHRSSPQGEQQSRKGRFKYLGKCAAHRTKGVPDTCAPNCNRRLQQQDLWLVEVRAVVILSDRSTC